MTEQVVKWPVNRLIDRWSTVIYTSANQGTIIAIRQKMATMHPLVLHVILQCEPDDCCWMSRKHCQTTLQVHHYCAAVLRTFAWCVRTYKNVHHCQFPFNLRTKNWLFALPVANLPPHFATSQITSVRKQLKVRPNLVKMMIHNYVDSYSVFCEE